MSTSPENDPIRPRAAEEELASATQKRREQEQELSMSERLAQVHELCKQVNAIAGAAKRAGYPVTGEQTASEAIEDDRAER